jgi:heterodisulfide reductase subunit B
MDLIVKALGAEPVDWSYKVDCCGASMALTRADVVIALSSRIAEAAQEAGADLVASACGICQLNLDTRQSSQTKIPVLYFTELMGLAFGSSEADKWFRKHAVDPRPVLRACDLV